MQGDPVPRGPLQGGGRHRARPHLGCAQGLGRAGAHAHASQCRLYQVLMQDMILSYVPKLDRNILFCVQFQIEGLCFPQSS